MSEQTDTPVSPSAPAGESIKDAFYRIVKRESIQLMEQVITHRLLKWLAIAWLIISAVTSIYRRADNRCDIKVPLDDYFYAKAICPLPKG